MAKKAPSTNTPTPRGKSLWATECPKNRSHEQIHVYRTVGRTRYCKCNDCGATWKVIGEAADKSLSEDERKDMLELAMGFQTAPRVTVDGVEVIQIDAAEAEEIGRRLEKCVA